MIVAVVLSLFAVDYLYGVTVVYECAEDLPFSDVNYSNAWTGNTGWAFGDTVIYSQDGFYNMGLYAVHEGRKTKLLEASDFFPSFDGINYVPYENYLYLCCGRYGEEDRFFRLELPSMKLEELPSPGTVMGNWFITSHDLICQDRETQQLWHFDFDSSGKTLLCAEPEDYGYADGLVQYVTMDTDVTLYTYDPESGKTQLTGSFPRPNNSGYAGFKFTPERLLLYYTKDLRQRNSGSDANLYVFTPETQEFVCYKMPRGIQQLTACDRYAYGLLYDAKRHSTDAVEKQGNGVYQIDLTDGSYSLLVEGDDELWIYSSGDEELYVMTSDREGIFYRTYLHEYSFASGELEYITALLPSFRKSLYSYGRWIPG